MSWRPLVASFLILAGCTETPELDMVEIKEGDTQFERLNNAARIMAELMNEGFPDMTCGSSEGTSDDCGDVVTIDDLHIQPVTEEGSGRVFLQCFIHDRSRYESLRRTCVGRIYEKLDL